MTLSVKFRKNNFKYSTVIGQTLVWNVFLVFFILGSHLNDFKSSEGQLQRVIFSHEMGFTTQNDKIQACLNVLRFCAPANCVFHRMYPSQIFTWFDPNYGMKYLIMPSVDPNSLESTKKFDFTKSDSKSWEFSRPLSTWSSKNSTAMFLVGHYYNNYTTYWHNSWPTAVTWLVVKYFVIEASISHTNKLLN